MAETFKLEVVSPTSRIVDAVVSDVVLPAYDGERGVLVRHENFVGVVGTGALKYVQDGNDYWCMVSSGIFEVTDGNVKILTEHGEKLSDFDVESEREKLRALEETIGNASMYEKGYTTLKRDYDQTRARLEVHHRTKVVN